MRHTRGLETSPTTSDTVDVEGGVGTPQPREAAGAGASLPLCPRGSSVGASPDWLLRSRELCTPSERHELARSLLIVLQTAQHALGDPLTRLDAPAILECSDRLLALVALLETDCRCHAQGLALTWLLIEEPQSPLFHANPHWTLEHALDEITAAL
jgi:hypothetical protein